MALIPAIIIAATWLGRIGLVAFAVNELKKLLSDNAPVLGKSLQEAEAAGLSDTEQKKMSAAVTFEQVESRGEDVDAWWGNLTPEEQAGLKFSPQTLRNDMQRTTFLGLAQTLLWIGAGVAASYAAYRGLPASLNGLAKITAIERNAKNATLISNELQIMKTAILNKVWVPGAVAGILGAGGWLTGSLMNNLNDATLWGRIFLNQAHEDVKKAAANASKGEAGAGTGGADLNLPKTIIRMTTEEKPKQFLGTVFSSKLGKAEHFERQLDDRITDMDDLEADVKVNLNRWLASLPNRMGYSVVIRKDPVDEQGAQQSGVWATLTLFITHISGKTTPIDTILLGPVEPAVRLELQKKTTSVENQISGFVQAATVREIQIPSGSVDIFDTSGNRIGLSEVAGGTTPAAQTSTAITPTPASQTPKPGVVRDAYIEISTGNYVNTQFANPQIIAGADAGIYKYVPASVVEGKGAAPSSTTSGTTQSTPSAPATGLYRVANTGGEGLNIRTAPSLKGSVTRSVVDGTILEFVQDAGTADGFTWWLVHTVPRGAPGYVASKFLVKV